MTLSTTAVVVLGYGLAGIVAFNLLVAKYDAVGAVTLIGVALNTVMVGLSLIISVLSKRKATALGVAILCWFLFTVLSDLSFLSVVVNLRAGPTAVLPLVLFNPVEISRILAVLAIGGSNEQLGSPAVILRFLLGSSTASVIVVVLSVWIVAVFTLLILVFRHQDVV